MKEGFYFDLAEADYHRDPCPSPSLSSSVAKILLNESAGHAWWAHPRLNALKALEIEEPTKAQLAGTALHRLILGKGRTITVIDAPDYRTNAAKLARDAATAAGEIPMLQKDMTAAEAIAEAARRRIGRTVLADLFKPDAGDAEVTMIWQEDNGIWCRARIDWLPHAALAGGHIIVPDIKTTGMSANPTEWQRTMFDFGGDIQTALYERGLRKLIPGVKSVRFPFVVIEQEPPYAVSLCRAGGQALEEARESVALAIAAWGELLKRGTDLDSWPFYGNDITDLDPPTWRSMAGEIRRMRMASKIADWQRPLDPDLTQAA